jgi:NTE family protein
MIIGGVERDDFSLGLNGNGTALVLSGGGARGAYQVGVLYGLLERGLVEPGPSPFPILVGTSAGSIHATAIAAWADQFDHAISELFDVWSVLQARHVFRTDLPSLARTAFRWARDIGFGGILAASLPSLCSTLPLSLGSSLKYPFTGFLEASPSDT